MNELIRANLRTYTSRYIATGLAIVLSVAFIVASTLMTTAFAEGMRQDLLREVVNADLVLEPTDDWAELSEDDIQRLLAVEAKIATAPGIKTAAIHRQTFSEINTPSGRRNFGAIMPMIPEALRWQTILEGSWPVLPDEIVIDQLNAKAFDLKIGDQLSFRSAQGSGGKESFKLVGISDESETSFGESSPALVVTEAGFDRIAIDPAYQRLLIAADEGGSPESIRPIVEPYLQEIPQFSIKTQADLEAEALEDLVGSSTVMSSLFLAFGLIALIVSGYVIANTFQVLVAQRTKELALLRCVGASQGQVRRMILGEATVVGLLFSVGGALLGWGAAIGLVALAVAKEWVVGIAPVTPNPLIMGGAILLGVLTTVIFAFAPARQAITVRPIQALRPVEGSWVPVTAKVSGLIGLVMALGGGGLMLFFAQGDSFLAAVLGGMVSAIGVLLFARLSFAPLIMTVSRPLGLFSPIVELGAANLGRNRIRTASTATALLIGTLLLSLLATGIHSSRISVVNFIDDRRKLDLAAYTTKDEPLSPDLLDRLCHDTKISACYPVPSGRVEVLDPSIKDGATDQEHVANQDGEAADKPREETAVDLLVQSIDAAALTPVLHSTPVTPEPGVMLVSTDNGDVFEAGETYRFAGVHGEVALKAKEAKAVDSGIIEVVPADFANLVGDPKTNLVYLRLVDDLGALEVQQAVTHLTTFDEDITVAGSAAERAMYNQILDTLLMIILGLLAVSLVIAIVGIGNTAALSMIERRRETAMVRSIGLTKGQLVAMITTESTLTALVAATSGVALGVFYAYGGLKAIESAAGKIVLDLYVPWAQMGAIILGAAVAGLIASLLPAIKASRRSLVEDLALT